MPPNLCRYCYKEISDRDELVTALNWFRIQPFHYLCFTEVEGESRTVWSTWTPINGVSGNISFLFMLLLSIIMLGTQILGYIGDLLGFIALYPVVLRLISFIIIEVRVTRKKEHS